MHTLPGFKQVRTHITTHAIGQHTSRRSRRLCRIPCYNTGCTQSLACSVPVYLLAGYIGGIERQKCQHVVDMYAPKQSVPHTQPQARPPDPCARVRYRYTQVACCYFWLPPSSVPSRSQLKATVGELAGAGAPWCPCQVHGHIQRYVRPCTFVPDSTIAFVGAPRN